MQADGILTIIIIIHSLNFLPLSMMHCVLIVSSPEYFDLSSQSVDEQQGTPPPAGYDLNDDALEEGFEGWI